MDSKNKNILVIDDDPVEREALERHLKDYSFIFETDPERAIANIIKTNPSIILLDLNMPKIDGFFVAREIRRHSETKDIPIIFTTFDKDNVNEKIAYEEFQAADWLVKPYNFNVLKTLVSRNIQLSHCKNSKILSSNNTIVAIGCHLENSIKNLRYKVTPVSANLAEVKEVMAKENPRIVLVYLEIEDEIVEFLKGFDQSIVVGLIRPNVLGSVEEKVENILNKLAHTTIRTNASQELINAKIRTLLPD